MGSIYARGAENLEMMLEKLSGNVEAILKMAVYDGAGVLAKAIAQAIDDLPTDSGPITPEHPIMNGPTQAQKDGLKEGFGISGMRTDNGDYINVKIGFAGYNDVHTKKYPDGQPNQLIARSIESGTTYMRKHHFVRRTVSRVKKAAEAAVQARLEKETAKITKGE